MRLVLRFAAVFLAVSTSVQAQSGGTQAPAPNPERARAFELYEQNRMTEARPILERLAAENPNDMVVLERLGMALVNSAMAASDAAERRALRVKARQVLLRAKELGDTSELLETMLAGIPEDGEDVPFSARKDVDAIMRRAEAAFGRGEMEKAREGYLQALALDPKLYEAALFIGDTYFREDRLDQAAEWFAKAIAIDPDIETAYRYWGDALFRSRPAEARAKYIEAIVANPYNNAPRNALGRLVQQHGLQFNVPQLKPGTAVTDEGGQTTVTVERKMSTEESKADGSTAWIRYGIGKAAWRMHRFKEEFPGEATYRHTLKEEAEALGVVAEAAARWQKEAATKTPPGTLRADLAELVRIHQAGLLEAFILLMRPDEGIAKDYAAYRKANREKLRRYLDEFVVPKIESPGRVEDPM